jgi:hypothetical protein
MRRHFALKRPEPPIVAHIVVQQTLAFAQGALIRGGGVAMFGCAREDKSIEKAPSVARRAGEQPVHRGRHPDHPRRAGQFAAFRCMPIHARDALQRAFRAALGADANAKLRLAEVKYARHAPGAQPFIGAGLLPARHFRQARAAQAAAGGEQGQRFKQIGFAGAVRAEQANGMRIEHERRAEMIAEIGEHKLAAPKACAHTRSGISTNSACSSAPSRTSVGELESANSNCASSP